MLESVLIADRGEAARAASASAQPQGLVRAAHAGELAAGAFDV